MSIIGAIGFIWLLDFLLAVLNLDAWLAAIVLVVYAIGLVVIGLLILLGPPGKRKNLNNVPLYNISAAVGFLDMLCNGIIEMGTVNNEDPKWNLPDFDNIPTRSRAGSTLYLLDKKTHKRWAKAVRSRVPKWRMLGVIEPRVGSMRFSEIDMCFSYIMLMGTIGMLLNQFLGFIGIVYAAVIAVLGIIAYIIYRKLRKEDSSEPISPDAFQEESCKALQIVLESIRKECTEKFKVFVIGKYEQLTYSGDSIETSNGYTIHEAIFEPRE